MFLCTLEFKFSVIVGKIRFSVCSGLGNLDVVVLRESDCFLTSFFLAMFESNEAVLIFA